jgi:hypothetical protein
VAVALQVIECGARGAGHTVNPVGVGI